MRTRRGDRGWSFAGARERGSVLNSATKRRIDPGLLPRRRASERLRLGGWAIGLVLVSLSSGCTLVRVEGSSSPSSALELRGVVDGYLAFGLNNEGEVEEFDTPMDEAEYTPEALRREGRR